MTASNLARAWRTFGRRVRTLGTAPEKWLYARHILPVSRLPLPDYLCIGAQKGGTTWLFRNMRPHPEIFVAREKEVHYFDYNFHWSLPAYAARFQPGIGKKKGDFTPGYCVLPMERIRFIRAVMPEARLILLARHPVERAWSHALMELVHRRKVPYESVPEAEFLAHFRSPDARAKGDYATILEKWGQAFPPEQILVCLNEEMRDQPQRLLTRVFQHVGVEAEVDWSAFPLHEVAGKGPSIPLPDGFRAELIRIYSEPIRRLRDRLGPCVDHWREPTGSQSPG